MFTFQGCSDECANGRRAGGGGKTKFRKDKIREKNKKLDENRTKRIEKERVAKSEGAGGREDASGIHPSRLARVQGGGY